MLKPQYTITNKLLANIKQINSLVIELNNRNFDKVVLYELERKAREISSHTSTSIEGNPLSLTVVKEIIKNQPKNLRSSEQEVLNYNEALLELKKSLEKPLSSFNLNLILSIHKKVILKLVPKNQLGKLRKEPVFVNNPQTNITIYWPPDFKDVKKLTNDLINFINSNKNLVDPLIIAGIFHKQFVIIHPFMDGNGRTARLITKFLLADLGINTFNLFSFENYYNKNVSNYFNNVGALGNYYDLVNSIDFTAWLEYFTDGIIDELFRVKNLLPKIPSNPEAELKPYHKNILKIIKIKGYIKDSDYARITKRAKATRNLDFKKLIGLGIIQKKGKGKNTYYQLKR